MIKKKALVLNAHNTLPKNGSFWQIEILPSIHILKQPDYPPDGDLLEGLKGYTVIGLQWLFWSVSLIINNK